MGRVRLKESFSLFFFKEAGFHLRFLSRESSCVLNVHWRGVLGKWCLFDSNRSDSWDSKEVLIATRRAERRRGLIYVEQR